jgi:CRP-like cAMP-binding protein
VCYTTAVENQKLASRLSKIWLPPDFSSFFKKYANRPPLKIRAGQTFLYEGDEPEKIYFIKRGFVKLYRMSPEGRSTIIYLYGPGSMLGLRALTSSDKKLRHTAQALTDAEIVTIRENEYLKILEENPEYIIDLLHVVISRLNYTERKLEGFILADATARVASFLSDLTFRFGLKNPLAGGGKIELPLPLTHQSIAEFVGAFRETVTVAVNRLKKEGVLTDERGKITIVNLRKLKEQALM